jgi:outer membrane protein assembly factor BamB
MRSITLARAATLLAAASLSAVSAAQTAALDYPQWRGHDRDGAASGFVVPSNWPEHLSRGWRVEVGEGYATPIVVGNVVYCFTRRDGREIVSAIEAATGKTIWQSGYPAAFTPSNPAARHGAGPKATPAFENGTLFTLGVSGIVAAVDGSTGQILWRTPPPAEAPLFGAAASPVVENGLVITHPGNYEPLTAFDAKTGVVKWTAGDGGFFAAPLIAKLGGVRQVVTVTQSSVIGVAVADGALLWRFPWSGGMGGTMPVLHGETIIVSGLDLGVSAFRPTRVADRWNIETVWETKDVSMYLSNPVVVGDKLFGFSHRASGQLFALDVQTGKVLWLGPPRQAGNAAVVKAGHVVFFLDDDAELIVTSADSAALDPIKRYVVADSATWAQPAISGNRLFIKDVSSLALWTVDSPR